jgi:hypothetical protein
VVRPKGAARAEVRPKVAILETNGDSDGAEFVGKIT